MKRVNLSILSVISVMAVFIFVLVSCGDDGPSFPDQTLFVGKTYVIPGDSEGWTSDNEFIASVENGVVTAERVGETIISNGYDSFKVRVKGYYDTYVEPCVDWGASKSAVKKIMSGYTILDEDEESLFYDSKYKEFCTYYIFKNRKLYLSSVVFDTSDVDDDELLSFLDERYVYLGYDDEGYYYISPDLETGVALSSGTINSMSIYLVVYVDASSATSSSAPSLLKKAATMGGATLTPMNKNEFSKLRKPMPEKITEIGSFWFK